MFGWLASPGHSAAPIRNRIAKPSGGLHLVRDLQGFRAQRCFFPGAETGILYVNLIDCPDAGSEAESRPPAIGVFCDQRKDFLG